MRKNKTARASIILFIAVLMTLSLVTGTMAKYVHATKGADVARVAQFEMEIQSYDDRGGDDDITNWTAAEAAINLFSTTANDTGVYDPITGDFDTNNGTKLIAPGTSGGFKINVNNYSEVAVKTTFTIQETFVDGKKIPIVYKYKNQNYSSYDVIGAVVGNMVINGSLADLGLEISSQVGNLAPTNGTTAVSVPSQAITWTWAFEGTDAQTNAKDTALAMDNTTGLLGQPTVTLSLTCTAEQINDYVAP